MCMWQGNSPNGRTANAMTTWLTCSSVHSLLPRCAVHGNSDSHFVAPTASSILFIFFANNTYLRACPPTFRCRYGLGVLPTYLFYPKIESYYNL